MDRSRPVDNFRHLGCYLTPPGRGAMTLQSWQFFGFWRLPDPPFWWKTINRAEGALSSRCITTDYSPMILECPRDAHRGSSDRYPDPLPTHKVALNRHGSRPWIVLVVTTAALHPKILIITRGPLDGSTTRHAQYEE